MNKVPANRAIENMVTRRFSDTTTSSANLKITWVSAEYSIANYHFGETGLFGGLEEGNLCYGIRDWQFGMRD